MAKTADDTNSDFSFLSFNLMLNDNLKKKTLDHSRCLPVLPQHKYAAVNAPSYMTHAGDTLQTLATTPHVARDPSPTLSILTLKPNPVLQFY
jgi:hypothetical protein